MISFMFVLIVVGQSNNNNNNNKNNNNNNNTFKTKSQKHKIVKFKQISRGNTSLFVFKSLT